MLRVALVGLGDAGGHHAEALIAARGVRWTAVCARSAESIARFANRAEVPESVERVPGLERLLDARVCDAVVLATPDALHAEQIIACASAGVSILAEKPLTLDVEEAERAVDACRAAGVTLAVGYHLRHHAGHRLVRESIERVGHLRRVAVRWAWPDPARDGWRASGASATTWSLAALGTHGIDLAMWIARCSEVTQYAAVFDPPSGVDRASELSFRLSNGTLVHVSASVTHRAPSLLRITGDQGEVTCERTLGARGGGRIRVGYRAESEPIEFPVAHPYTAQLENFAARVADDDRSDEAVRDAIANVRLIERVRKTA